MLYPAFNYHLQHGWIETVKESVALCPIGHKSKLSFSHKVVAHWDTKFRPCACGFNDSLKMSAIADIVSPVRVWLQRVVCFGFIRIVSPVRV